jgi:hypothetical protein
LALVSEANGLPTTPKEIKLSRGETFLISHLAPQLDFHSSNKHWEWTSMSRQVSWSSYRED